MAHTVVPEAEAILDQSFPVLDKGFVRLVDYLGGDARIVQAARVSYGAGTRSVREDAALIDYLMRHRHTSPFEQVVLTFHVKLPIFVARQWVRHRTARLNEISGRYSVMKDEFYTPTVESLRTQSEVNKQGRSEAPLSREEAEAAVEGLRAGQKEAYALYEAFLKKNLAREVARIGLPLSLYTEWYWQMDLNNLFHFLELRLHPHAQWEIREYARVILEITRKVAPCATAAFERHRLHSVTFSPEAAEWIKARLQGQPDIPREVRERLGIE
jgi:thymidylate synthase (FAD)